MEIIDLMYNSINTDSELDLLCSYLGIKSTSLYGCNREGKIISLYEQCRCSQFDKDRLLYWISNKIKFTTDIYFSYAWNSAGYENIETPVQILYNEMSSRGYEIKRDIINLHYGNSIIEFMNNLGKAKLVVIFLSEKYLRSINCMYELHEVFRNSRYEIESVKSRIFIVNVDNKKAPNSDELINYWKEKQKEDKDNTPFFENLIHYLPSILKLIKDINYYTYTDDKECTSNIITHINRKIHTSYNISIDININNPT
ncbi:toll/interleukin-1 receptor domain-containing protein [uncultured Bacteroides sp.]|uniref:toll/interleukin-1 receptor domain-containing protein n=1 Tax=uncultured Bacteroides sp. TaxID=162156 RepID=UPI002AAB48A8|nr:toll/interleukin-1 receptor domain-containing protein [uncultured Bacteroides sp.]